MKGQKMNLRKEFSEKTWSLFLDRDGVINQRYDDDYVKTWEEFVFIPGALEAIRIFSGIFNPIVVVTNQQGIGKQLMTVETLNLIHNQMVNEISRSGGKIDKVYFCGDLKNSGSINRKPGIGMGLQAKNDFPIINFKRSVMVGDTINDMIFGKRLNMKTVFISDDPLTTSQNHRLIDFQFDCLYDFAKTLK